MTEATSTRPILVVGAGPAGIAAACALAERGERPIWIDQNQQPGGAFHRQPLAGIAAVKKPSAARAQWQRLEAAMARHALSPRTGCVFLGVDGEGHALIDDRQRGAVLSIRPRAVIAATGAVEHVRPFAGWTLPGVVTAGGLQILLKATGSLPPGRILLAGNGPLMLALAAQMAAAGRPPVAVLERAPPRMDASAMLALAARPGLFAEAAGYAARMIAAGIPLRFGAAIQSIIRAPEGLIVEVSHRGRPERYVVDVVAVHDGIRTNDFGLPAEGGCPVPVLRAGDCRETLGWLAAEQDGRLAAIAALADTATAGSAGQQADAVLARERSIQRALRRLFAPASDASADQPGDATILCRCENRTVGDLKALLAANPGMTEREIKLNGRFVMGSCQGRFCADAVLAALASAGCARDLTGSRWPIRPVAISALLAEPSSFPDRDER